MTEHGIWTTAATHWAHLHPIEPALYHYEVAACREYIGANGLQPIVGYSKDRTATGSGYLIPKSAHFIKRVPIRRDRIECLGLDWERMNDHQVGLKWGEALVVLFISMGILGFEPDDVRRLGWADQLQACDFEIAIGGRRIKWEAKTERVRSSNLFVQRGESGHRPHVLPRESWSEMWSRPFDFDGLKEPPG